MAWSICVGWMPWGYLADSGIMDRWAQTDGVTVEIVQINDCVWSINRYTAGACDGVTATNRDTLSIPAGGGRAGGRRAGAHRAVARRPRLPRDAVGGSAAAAGHRAGARGAATAAAAGRALRRAGPGRAGAEAAQDVCAWRQAVNRRGPRDGPDVGRLALTRDGLAATGIHADCDEFWTKAHPAPCRGRALTEGDRRAVVVWSASAFAAAALEGVRLILTGQDFTGATRAVARRRLDA